MNRRNDSRSRRARPSTMRDRVADRQPHPPLKKPQAGKLRIIGGEFRGRTFRYHGSTFTRPMKDSVRENLFNILGTAIRGTIAFDLFAGTGAVAMEALSRGAASAVAVEQSRYAVQFIRESVQKLGVEHRFRVITGDAFRLAPKLISRPLNDTPWAVFLCPPYQMWEDETDFEALRMIIRLVHEHAPPGSLLVAETERRFDPSRLPSADWDLREYGDTRLAISEPALRCGLDL